MKRLTKRLLLTILVAFVAIAPLYAGFDQGLSAYRDGNYERAFDEFRADAISGHATAQFNLGVMYYKGQGVERDLIQAYAWIELASQQHGNEDLNEALEVLTVMLSREEIEQGLDAADRLARTHDLKYRPSRSERSNSEIARR